MSNLLKAGENLMVSGSSAACKVKELLGEGGQGEVYRVVFEGKEYAAKWYFSATNTILPRDRIVKLCMKGAPDERFLWPSAILHKNGSSSFGYLMPLREPRFYGLAPIVRGRIQTRHSALATAGLQLADSFAKLHLKGLCYCDISFGNIFLDPHTGDIAICDNDNVTVNKDPKVAVLGTMRFMAPEVVRKASLPSTQTDLYSLAVFFFYMLMREHPLHGKKEASIHCLDDLAALKIYGSEATFMFDPNDRSNEPHPEYHNHVELLWRLCPSYMRQLFIRSFTTGIMDPEHGRVRETEWRSAFCRWRDSMVYCASCGAENSFDDSRQQLPNCWVSTCGKPIPMPPRLKLGSSIITCHEGRVLYGHHLDGSYDFSTVMAEVVANPKDKTQLGLRNRSQVRWVIQGKDGSLCDIEPGKAISLRHAADISFGKTHATVF